MKIFVAVPKLYGSSIELLENSGYEICYNRNKEKLSHTELKLLIKDCDGVLAGVEKYTEEILAYANGLKCISRIGVSTTNIDLKYSAEKNIKVVSVDEKIRDKYAVEYIVSHCLLLQHDVLNKYQKNNSIANSNILIIGYNNISEKTADILRSVGANVHIFDFEKDVPMKFYCSLNKQMPITNILIVNSKIKRNQIDQICEKLARNTAVIDPFNMFVYDSNMKRINCDFIKSYWIDQAVNGVDDKKAIFTNGIITRNSHYLEEIENEAIKMLIGCLGE